jgi:PAS domain S-box-containing protein
MGVISGHDRAGDGAGGVAGEPPEVSPPGGEALFSALAETVDAAVLIFQGSRHVYANSAAARVTGYSRAELLACDPFTLIHPDDRDVVRARALARARGEAVPSSYEVKLLTKGGETRWSEFRVAVISYRGAPASLITAYDITERKLKAEELRESEERYRLLSDAIPQFVFTTDAEGRCDYVNRRWFDYSGMTPEATRGYGWMAAVHPDDLARLAARWDAAMRGGGGVTVEHRFRRADGVYRWFLNRSLPMRDARGEVTKWVGTATDIEDAKQAEAEVSRLNDELERRVAERTAQLEAAVSELEAFSYSVSHDLRAPLRAIDGFSRILLEGHAARLDADAEHLLNVVRDNARRMGQLIDDLLAFSRAGRKEAVKARIDMQALAREVLGELLAAGGGGRHAISVGELPPALGDARLVRQALTNLVSNALKFSRHVPAPRVEISARRAGREQVYCVRDNGVGFDMRYAARLFGVFQRLHSQAEFEGTGVGLAIVQRIIQRHGGRVWAEGSVGAGAAFYFTLPAADE